MTSYMSSLSSYVCFLRMLYIHVHVYFRSEEIFDKYYNQVKHEIWQNIFNNGKWQNVGKTCQIHDYKYRVTSLESASEIALIDRHHHRHHHCDVAALRHGAIRWRHARLPRRYVWCDFMILPSLSISLKCHAESSLLRGQLDRCFQYGWISSCVSTTIAKILSYILC